MNKPEDKTIEQVFTDRISVDRALNRAVQQAVWKHKL